MTYEDLVLIARICFERVRETDDRRIASKLRRIAQEHLERAAKLNGGRRPDIEE